MSTGLEAFDSSLQKSTLWIKDIMHQLATDDRHRAYLAMLAVLHTLRDHLTPDEAADLGAQLPVLIRGFYYEGWKPAHKPVKERHREQFLRSIAGYFTNEPDVDAEQVLNAVLRVMERKITAGEMQDVRGQLPPEIRELWSEPQEVPIK